MTKLPLILSAMFMSSCVSLKSVSLTQIPKKRKQIVFSETSKFIFFGLNFDNDFVDDITDDLKNQCEFGKISGILTKDELTDYFLHLVVKRQVSVTGYCVKSSRSKGA